MKRNNIEKSVLKQRIAEANKNPKDYPLTKVGVRAILSQRKYLGTGYMMATTAYHLMGEISRDEYDLCYINSETDKYHIGNWITGYGFFDVLFPKKTTRPLTKEEIDKHNGTFIQVSSQPPIELKVD